MRKRFSFLLHCKHSYRTIKIRHVTDGPTAVLSGKLPTYESLVILPMKPANECAFSHVWQQE